MKPIQCIDRVDGEKLFHKCSIYGCGNTRTRLFVRSKDRTGGIYLCDECLAELAAFVPVEPEPEPEPESDEEEPVPEPENETPPVQLKRSRKTGD